MSYKHNKFKALIYIFSIFLIGSISALTYSDCAIYTSSYFETYKSGDCITISTIANSSAVTISSISFPNSTKAIGIKNMTKEGLTFTYPFCNTSKLGVYKYYFNDSEGNVYVNSFKITANGREEPSGIVIVSFSIMFLVIAAFLFYFLIYTCIFFIDYKFTEGESKPLFTLKDFLVNISGYFILLLFYYLERAYFGNELVSHILSISTLVGSFTNIMLPIIALFLSFTLSTWKQLREAGNFTKW